MPSLMNLGLNTLHVRASQSLALQMSMFALTAHFSRVFLMGDLTIEEIEDSKWPLEPRFKVEGSLLSSGLAFICLCSMTLVEEEYRPGSVALQFSNGGSAIFVRECLIEHMSVGTSMVLTEVRIV